MENIIKLLGIIAFAVVIGFSMTACGDGGGGGGGGTAPIITASITTLPGGTVGTVYTSHTFEATGDTPTWSISDGALPEGLDLAPSTGVLSGTPTARGTFNFTVKATNSAGNDTKSFGIEIARRNGMMWQSTGSAFSSTAIYGVAYGNSKWIAVGSDGKMSTSTNNVQWTAISATDSKFGSSSIIYGVAYGNNKWVAGGYGGKMSTSTDGTTWTEVEDSAFNTDFFGINGVAYGSDKWVAVGQRGRIAYSTNGTTWTEVEDSTFGTTVATNTINDVAYGGGKWVAVGGGGQIATSTDGTTWTKVTDSTFGTTANTINGVAYGDGRWTAVGGGSKTAYSDDGTTWKTATITPSGNSIAYGDGTWVAAGSMGLLAYSKD